MKKLAIAGGFVSMLAIAACSDEAGDSGQASNGSNNDGGTNDEELEPVDVVDTEEGVFEVFKQAGDGETHETGPMMIEVEQVHVGSAQLEGYVSAFTGGDDIDYIQLDVHVENTSADGVHFPVGHASVKTNTGEELEVPNIVLSDETNHEFAGNETQSVSLIYPLEETSVSEIDEAQFWVKGPSEEAESEQIADDVSFTVQFK